MKFPATFRQSLTLNFVVVGATGKDSLDNDYEAF